MKRCPTCDKTFEDSMRFCQVDGTALVDDAPAFDPYATIVGRAVPAEPEASPDPAPGIPETVDEPAADPQIHYTVGSIPIAEPDDVLDLPSNDPLKTMYVSDAEMEAALGKDPAAPDIIDIPPIEAEPITPSFIEPSSSLDAAPPPSPFAGDSSFEQTAEKDAEQIAPAIFPDPVTPEHDSFEPAKSDFDEAATMMQPSFQSPFDQPAPVAEWTPPPAPADNWQNQDVVANTPFQAQQSVTGGQNKTLAIISLVCGILGMTVCCGSFAVSIVALVTGFMARGKANSNPNEFGGAGLAMGGIITGALGLVLSIIFVILYLAGAIAGGLGNF